MAQRIPNNNQVAKKLWDKYEDLHEHMDTHVDAVSVVFTELDDCQCALDSIGDMCLKSQHDKLYYLDDDEFRFYFTADNDQHALVRLGL